MVTPSEFLTRYNAQLAYSVTDLRSCEFEPIASCGAIQSVGYFLSADLATHRVLSLSQNLLTLLNLQPDEAWSRPLEDFLALDEGQDLEKTSLEQLRHRKFPVLFLRLDKAKSLRCQAHIAFDQDTIHIDLEPDQTERGKFSHDHLHRLISRLESSLELETDCTLVCEAFRDMAGFDKVMAYRFHGNWDGEVIAEARDERHESFLGLRYPASDIPEQARQLYLKSPYRMIVDTQALPVPILTRNSEGRMNVRLGKSALRAASPIHVEYLLNMGVRSSFSVPIKVHNKLWGLISCHHYQEALHLHPETRSALELVGRILSGRVANFIERRRLLAKKRSLEFSQTFIQNLTDGLPTKASFEAAKDQLLAMLQASGAFVRIQGEEISLGQCPPKATIDLVIRKAKERSVSEIWKSNCLKEALEQETMPAQAAGALIVLFSFGFDDCIIWFRPELLQDVRWGGDPKKLPNAYGRLTPRASFASWVEKVKNQSAPWSEENEEAAQFLLFHFIKGIFSKAAALSLANKELERVTRAKDEFIGMVSHELRTPLSAIIGWIDILKDSVSPDNAEVLEAVEVIDRNAKLQINLINDLLDISRIISGKMRLALKPNVNVCALARDVVESLRPTAHAKSLTLSFSCDEDILASLDSDRMRQVIWNLLSNAIKFTPHNGEVRVRVEKLSAQYRLIVTDNGIGLEADNVKRIFDRFNQVEGTLQSKIGLGLGLSISKSLVELHGGVISARSPGLGKGTSFIAELPIFAVFQEAPRSPSETRVISAMPSVLKDKRVLLVEDQQDTAAALKHLIEKMGGICTVHHNGLNALETLKERVFDLIISDVGMPDMNGYELMQAYRAYEKAAGRTMTPAIALTAYATSKDRTAALASGFQSHIPKPVDKSELLAVIESLRLTHS